MKRTSRAIERKITRLRALTLHISPYPTGLAPETRNVVEYMNAEAKRLRTGVQFTATANPNATAATARQRRPSAAKDTNRSSTPTISM